MEESVKTSINARYSAFKSAYKIDDKNLEKKIDDLFKKINEFGKSCKDSMDFETKFATSELNTEYINLFSEVASKCEQVVYDEAPDHHIKTDEKLMKEEIESEARYRFDSATMPLRRIAREKIDSKLRDTPLGKIEQANNMRYLFGKWFKK